MEVLQQVYSPEVNDEVTDRRKVRRRFSVKQIVCSLEASNFFSGQPFTILPPSSAVYHPIFEGTVLPVVQ